MTQFTHLSQPAVIGSRTVKNRIVVPPMAYFGGAGPDGLVTEKHLRHYGAFAKGGAGLVIVEACSVSRIPDRRNAIHVFDDTYIEGMKSLAKATRQNGAVALVQLINPGLRQLPYDSIEEIPRSVFLKYQSDFADAAVRCQRAGFDGVELHAAHGYYLDQILETSQRTDGYGGSIENRCRIITELVQEIHSRCGRDFIVSVRFGIPDFQELKETARAIERAGGDLINISTGFDDYEKPADFPYSGRIYAASLLKQEICLPIIGIGNIRDGQTAETVLAAGYCDLIAVGRGHLCDPAWAGKVLAGEDPVPCLNCHPCICFRDGDRCQGRTKTPADTGKGVNREERQNSVLNSVVFL